MSKDFSTATRERRTIYALSKELPISEDRVTEIVKDAVKHTPSAFNSQSSTVVVLFNEQHDKLWDMTTAILKEIVSPDQFEATAKRMAGFRGANGTVLFFEDQAVVEGMQAAVPSYQDRFPTWSQQASGMLQYVIWTALEAEGLGANLQHYNPLIDEKVKSEWNLPETWQLVAQMPFGKPTAPAGEKEYKPLEDRVKIIK